MKLEFDQKRSTLNAQKYVINLVQKILSSDYTCAVMASLAPVVGMGLGMFCLIYEIMKICEKN